MKSLRGFLFCAVVFATAALAASAMAESVKIVGNQFVNGSGKTIQLRGINAAAGSDGNCVLPAYEAKFKNSFAYSPTKRSDFAVIKTWGANSVRITLNEDCWLGINPVQRFDDHIKPYTGKAARTHGKALGKRYRRQVTQAVNDLRSLGFIVILDLHLSAPGKTLAFAQYSMPDSDHSPSFWKSVARTFKSNSSVMFEIFNEPIYKYDKLTWSCLRDGCRLPNACGDCEDGLTINGGGEIPGCGKKRCPTKSHARSTYRTAGTQRLVNTIRATGARNPILSPGRLYTNDLGEWLKWKPKDRLGQIGASFHAYNGLPCQDSCWNSTIASVAARVPVATTEFGSDQGGTNPCNSDAAWDEGYLNWADSKGVSYLAWWWFAPGPFDAKPDACDLGLLANYGGTPRFGHGAAVRAHYLARAGQ